jgi:hypothetical protein
MLSIYYNFKRSSQPFLNALVLPAMSSQIATYVRMASPYLTPVVNFTACSFGHFIWTRSTPLFYRRTVKKILTRSSSAHKTLTFTTHTDNIACWLTCWSLSLCSVQCLWSLSLGSVRCSLWSLSLCSVCSLSLSSLPPLCSDNECPYSSYGLTSKWWTSQSHLPFQHSAVPKILQWMSTAIKSQPSWHPRCCFLSPKLSQNLCSHSIIFTGTSADLSTYIYDAI